MFIKKITKGNKQDKQYTYYRLCESVRIGTKTRHQNLLNLGSLEGLNADEQKHLANRIESLYAGKHTLFIEPSSAKVEELAHQFYKKLRGKLQKETTAAFLPKASTVAVSSDFQQVDINSVQHDDVREVGAEWLCLQAIQELKIPDVLQAQGWLQDTVNTALAHLVSRAVYPASEHKTAQWMESSSAISELLFKEHQSISYQRLYKTSDLLFKQKETLEKHLSTHTNELFKLNDTIVLYDLTNTYFEGRKVESEIAQFGRSKEKRSDAKLVSLALVINPEGFVKYSKIYQGNISEPDTLLVTIESLSAATGNSGSKPIVVMDAGIATEKNLTMLKEKDYDYLCVTRAKLKDYKCVDISKLPIQLYDNRQSLIEVQKVKHADNPDSFLYVKSTKKALKEEAMEAHFSVRFEEELNQLSQGLSKKGTTKKAEKISERIGRIKERYPAANKHYDIKLNSKNGIATKLSFTRKQTTPPKNHGVYFLRTSLTNIDEKTFWEIYNTLTEVEASFRILKTDLSLRPVFHQKDDSTMAHIHLGLLAYMVVNTIRYKLKQKNIHHDWRNIIRIMNTQKLVTTSFNNKKGQVIILKKCSQPNAEVLAIYEALIYKPKPFTMKKFVLPQ